MSEIPAYTLERRPGRSRDRAGKRGPTCAASLGRVLAVSGIEAGYRMLDSAFNLENEGARWRQCAAAAFPDEELRLVSKLPGATSYDEAAHTPRSPPRAQAWD